MRARGLRVRVPALEDEDVCDSSLSIHPRRGIFTGVIVPKFVVCENTFLARAALRSGFLASENSFRAECDHVLEEQNRYKMENE